MNIQPITVEAVLEWLQNQAATNQAPIIVQARFAISHRETRLLALQPEGFLETISF